ncbi:response regulator [Oscillatoria amoena NRMC-F 0135]|nr:response regulator [Oscillatoria amoena NRMC-F 0135]MDL5053468.1 response regulator [Oscillatoria laete-virens NRMC-F 0139]
MPKVLVVEDDPSIRRVIQARFDQEKWEVHLGSDGQQGLEQARKLLPDVIIADIMLPVMTGLELLQKLKADPATKAIPVVFLTQKGAASDIVKGLQMGAADYVRKPFNLAELQARVEKALASSPTSTVVESSKLTIAGRPFRSRLMLGTGKFPSNAAMRDALELSGAEIVTVALRRANLSGEHDPSADILDYIDPQKYLILPNTSGAQNAAEAIRLAKLARSAGLPSWVKLEIHPDPHYLLPDPIETLEAAQELVKEGFTVLPYINADPVLAKRLQDVGCATVMPLGAPIGSNRGIETRKQIEIIIEQAGVPVVVDAGIGAPSQAAEAMEMGAEAVLVNTAIAIAPDPCGMAKAFAKAVEAGREAFEIGLGGRLPQASATSPLTGFLDH